MTHPRILVNLAPAVSTDVCRWLFQHWGMELAESLHVPVFHVLALAWYRTGNDQRPLIVDGSDKFRTEEDIVHHYDPLASAAKQLVPADLEQRRLTLELREYFHRQMRAHGAVKYSYWHMLKQKDLVWRSFTTGTPSFERVIASVSFPIIRFILTKGLDLNEDNAKKGLAIVHEAFDKVEALLDDGRNYLTGDQFTIADLTFAAGAAPMVLAHGYAGNLPELDILPDAMQAVVKELRARPAGLFCQKMYDLHRRGPQ